MQSLRHRGRAWVGAALCAGLAAALGGCQAYDAARLAEASKPGPELAESAECGNARLDDGERCDPGIEAEAAGACPERCDDSDPCARQVRTGSGCQIECVTVAATEAREGDGCCPEGVGPGEDSDCGECGDGIIGPTESCDPPESCPTKKQCAQRNQCLVGVFSGDPERCTARCELSVVRECVDGDGCCAEDCSAGSDDDCSASCGDGAVQVEAGETCELEDRAAPCSESCDDGESCTRDLLTGSASNCNAQCTAQPINEARNGDGCCPPGAHALIDDDCAPACGNGIVEPGEACDGGGLCSAGCTLTDEGQCVAADTTNADQVCKQCRCQRCTQSMLGCFDNPDPTFVSNCRAVVECGHDAHCTGDACYCGSNTFCNLPNGPCRSAIDRAAAAEGQSVANCSDDATCSLSQTAAIGACVEANCRTECGQ
jgi:hypothetical protein